MMRFYPWSCYNFIFKGREATANSDHHSTHHVFGAWDQHFKICICVTHHVFDSYSRLSKQRYGLHTVHTRTTETKKKKEKASENRKKRKEKAKREG